MGGGTLTNAELGQIDCWGTTPTTRDRMRWGWTTEAIGVGPVNFWDPCSVAGIRVTVGGCRGLTEDRAGAGLGTGTGTATDSETGVRVNPTSTSEGIVQVFATEEDGTPESGSSSIGNSRRGEGAADWVWEGPAAGAGVRCLLSGTSWKVSLIQIRPRKDSSAPVNQCTCPSMLSSCWTVRLNSSTTLSKALTRASRTAIRFSCSMCSYLKSEIKILRKC